MNRTTVLFASLVVGCVTSLANPSAQATQATQATPDPWYSRQAKPQNFDGPKVFTGAFSIELPKNWQLASGHGGSVFTVVEKTKKWEAGALVTLEYLHLQVPLDPTLIAGAGERELKEVQAREPEGKQFTGAVKTGPLGPIIFIQYTRPGLSGGEDHVVQYSIPIGMTMYRLICVVAAPDVEKYKPIFAHVAASFMPVNRRS